MSQDVGDHRAGETGGERLGVVDPFGKGGVRPLGVETRRCDDGAESGDFCGGIYSTSSRKTGRRRQSVKGWTGFRRPWDAKHTRNAMSEYCFIRFFNNSIYLYVCLNSVLECTPLFKTYKTQKQKYHSFTTSLYTTHQHDLDSILVLLSSAPFGILTFHHSFL